MSMFVFLSLSNRNKEESFKDIFERALDFFFKMHMDNFTLNGKILQNFMRHKMEFPNAIIKI